MVSKFSRLGQQAWYPHPHQRLGHLIFTLHRFLAPIVLILPPLTSVTSHYYLLLLLLLHLPPNSTFDCLHYHLHFRHQGHHRHRPHQPNFALRKPVLGSSTLNNSSCTWQPRCYWLENWHLGRSARIRSRWEYCSRHILVTTCAARCPGKCFRPCKYLDGTFWSKIWPLAPCLGNPP